jgi:hypothetical protein
MSKHQQATIVDLPKRLKRLARDRLENWDLTRENNIKQNKKIPDIYRLRAHNPETRDYTRSLCRLTNL